jgi:hypothetical protein
MPRPTPTPTPRSRLKRPMKRASSKAGTTPETPQTLSTSSKRSMTLSTLITLIPTLMSAPKSMLEWMKQRLKVESSNHLTTFK